MSIQKFLMMFFLWVTIAFLFSLPMYADEDASYYFKKAQIQYQHQMYIYAVENLERVLIINPKHTAALNLLATIYLNHYNNRVRALQFYNQSLAIDDNQPDVHCEVGKLYVYFSEYNHAIDHFTKTIAQQGKAVEAHYHLALVYNTLKQCDTAAVHADECNRLTKNDTDMLLTMADDALQKNEKGVAIAQYSRALQINPACKAAYHALALLYRQDNSLANAIEVLEQCIKVYPHDNTIAMTLAHLCFEYKPAKRRKYYIDRAITLCKGVVERDPLHCEAYSLLYDVYKTLHDVPLMDNYAEEYNRCCEK